MGMSLCVKLRFTNRHFLHYRHHTACLHSVCLTDGRILSDSFSILKMVKTPTQQKVAVFLYRFVKYLERQDRRYFRYFKQLHPPAPLQTVARQAASGRPAPRDQYCPSFATAEGGMGCWKCWVLNLTSEKFLWQCSGTFVGLMAFHPSPWVIAYPQFIGKMTFPLELCGDRAFHFQRRFDISLFWPPSFFTRNLCRFLRKNLLQCNAFFWAEQITWRFYGW